MGKSVFFKFSGKQKFYLQNSGKKSDKNSKIWVKIWKNQDYYKLQENSKIRAKIEAKIEKKIRIPTNSIKF